jgi:osmotically inducible protein OsmC
MSLSKALGLEGMTVDSIETRATVSLEKGEAVFSVTSSHLQMTARIPNANKAAFEKAVEAARSGCPVSRLLNATITIEATLA